MIIQAVRMLKLIAAMSVLSVLFQIIGEYGSKVVSSTLAEIDLPVLGNIAISSAVTTPFLAFFFLFIEKRYQREQSVIGNVQRHSMPDVCVFFIMLSVYVVVNISACALTFSADTIKKSVINQCVGFSVFSVLFVSLHMLFSHVFDISLSKVAMDRFSLRGTNAGAYQPQQQGQGNLF